MDMKEVRGLYPLAQSSSPIGRTNPGDELMNHRLLVRPIAHVSTPEMAPSSSRLITPSNQLPLSLALSSQWRLTSGVIVVAPVSSSLRAASTFKRLPTSGP